MKTILCLIDGLSAGGAQRQLVGLACLLKDRGYNVYFMWYHSTSFYKKQLEENGINCINNHPQSVITKIINVYNTINEVHPDTIIAYLDGPTIICCLLKMLGLKNRLIVSERNTTQVLNRHESIKFWMYRFSDYIVPNSYSQERFIRKHYKNLISKINTITNFVDTSFYIPSAVQQNREILKVLIIGRVNTQKNVLRFLKSVSILKENGVKIHIDWYGDHSFNRQYWEEVVSQYNQLGLKGYLDFHDPENNILGVYQDSDVFCLPSLYEGYPNVICEAMSCGLPVVCSDVCDNPSIIENGKNGYLFDPLSIDSMVDAITKIAYLERGELRAMGEHSRHIAQESFGKDVFLESYTRLIEQ